MSRVTSKLQVTLPKGLADKLGIKPGDEIDWEIAGDALRVTPVTKRRKSKGGSEDRLRWFDQATRRQQKRHKIRGRMPATSRSVERGWTRQELYTRGRKTRAGS